MRISIKYIIWIILLGVTTSVVFAQSKNPSAPTEALTAEACFAQTVQRLQTCMYLGVEIQGEIKLFNQHREIRGTYQEMRSENRLANGQPVFSLRYDITFTDPNNNTPVIPMILILDGKNQKLWQNMNFLHLKLSEVKDPYDAAEREYYVDLNVIADRYLSEPTRFAKYGPPWYGQRSMENILRELQDTFTFDSPLENSETGCWDLKGQIRPEIVQKVRKERGLKDEFPQEIPRIVHVSISKTTQLIEQIRYGDEAGKPFLTVFFKNYQITDRFDPEPFQHDQGTKRETNVTDDFLLTIE